MTTPPPDGFFPADTSGSYAETQVQGIPGEYGHAQNAAQGQDADYAGNQPVQPARREPTKVLEEVPGVSLEKSEADPFGYGNQGYSNQDLGSPFGAAEPAPLPAYGDPGYGPYGAPGYGPPGFGAGGYGPAGYPVPGYGAPGYGAPGYGVPGYAPVPSGPSGGTAITSAILALLGCAWQSFWLLWVGIFGLAVLAAAAEHDVPGWAVVLMLVGFVLQLAQTVLLGWGGIALLMRKRIGKILTVTGCGLVIVFSLGGVLLLGSIVTAIGGDYSAAGAMVIMSLFGLIFPVLTLVLALVPSTTEWINYDRSLVPPVGYPGYGPPAPYY